MTPRALRVLLVDDSDAFRRSAGRYLSHQGNCELVGTASSGNEALQKVAALHPDLVLLGVVMPDMDGLEVARRLRSQSSPPRVVMVTTQDDALDRKSAREAGADGFITKSNFALQIIELLGDIAEKEEGNPEAGVEGSGE